MSNVNDGGQAFPGIKHDANSGTVAVSGMSLRAYFAGKALETFRQNNLGYGTMGNPQNPWPDVAKECVRAADALIEELNR